MISLSDSCTEDESCKQNAPSKRNTHCNQKQEQQQQQQQQKHFTELLRWISQEGEEFVHLETLTDLKDVFVLLDIIGKSQNPVLMTILIGENEPNLVTVSLSNVRVSVQCSLFCMFPT